MAGGRRIGLLMMTALVVVVVCVVAVGWAWVDGGREPLRVIAQSVPVPEVSE